MSKHVKNWLPLCCSYKKEATENLKIHTLYLTTAKFSISWVVLCTRSPTAPSIYSSIHSLYPPNPVEGRGELELIPAGTGRATPRSRVHRRAETPFTLTCTVPVFKVFKITDMKQPWVPQISTEHYPIISRLSGILLKPQCPEALEWEYNLWELTWPAGKCWGWKMNE